MRKFLRFVLIIISSISILLILFSYILNNTVLDREYVLKKMEKNNYYDEVYDLCYSNFENYIYQSGFEENVIENIISIDDIRRDVGIVVNNIYCGNCDEINYDNINEKVRKNIEENNKNFKFDEDNLNEFINCLIKEYKSAIIHTSYEKKISNYVLKIKEILNLVDKILVATSAISLIILALLDAKPTKKIMQSFEMIFLINFVIIFAIFLNIIYNVNVGKIKIFNLAFSILIKSIFKNIIFIFACIDAIFLAFAILFAVKLHKIYSRMNIENKTRRRKWKKLI